MSKTKKILMQCAILLVIGALLFLCNVIYVNPNFPPLVVIIEPTKSLALPRIMPSEFRSKIGNDEDRMAGPVMPENPTQADLGATQYWVVCMACHGDVGQGLLDEWREAWGPEEMNCWQSKCHGTSHPPNGFELIRYAPPVIREGALLRFETAQDYFDYISIEMPWWRPGYLEEDIYWNLTAYMLRENGVEFIGDITPENASSLYIN
jgi:hypothetical protein